MLHFPLSMISYSLKISLLFEYMFQYAGNKAKVTIYMLTTGFVREAPIEKTQKKQ